MSTTPKHRARAKAKNTEELQRPAQEQRATQPQRPGPGGGAQAVHPFLYNILKGYMSSAADERAGKGPARKPSFIVLGPPGVGKSEAVVEQLPRLLADYLGRRDSRDGASACYTPVVYDEKGIDAAVGKIRSEGCTPLIVVDLRLTEVEPSDLIGVPRADPSNAFYFYLPPKWAKYLSEYPGILFLDEITNVDRIDVLAASYKLVLDKKVGMLALHPDTLVVAAGNTREHSRIARDLPQPLINRAYVINVPEVTVDEWVRYMKNRGLDPPEWVVEFLYATPGALLRVPTTPKGTENFPTPRAWTDVIKLLLSEQLLNESLVTQALLVGRLGNEVGSKLYSLYTEIVRGADEVYRKYVQNPESVNELISEYIGSAEKAIAEGDTVRFTKPVDEMVKLMHSLRMKLVAFLKKKMDERERRGYKRIVEILLGNRGSLEPAATLHRALYKIAERNGLLAELAGEFPDFYQAKTGGGTAVLAYDVPLNPVDEARAVDSFKTLVDTYSKNVIGKELYDRLMASQSFSDVEEMSKEHGGDDAAPYDVYVDPTTGKPLRAVVVRGRDHYVVLVKLSDSEYAAFAAPGKTLNDAMKYVVGALSAHVAGVRLEPGKFEVGRNDEVKYMLHWYSADEVRKVMDDFERSGESSLAEYLRKRGLEKPEKHIGLMVINPELELGKPMFARSGSGYAVAYYVYDKNGGRALAPVSIANVTDTGIERRRDALVVRARPEGAAEAVRGAVEKRLGEVVGRPPAEGAAK